MPQPNQPSPGRYFDYNGSTPLHPRVQALCRELSELEFGNSAAPHPAGQSAGRVVEEARAGLAAALGAAPREIFFTGGGTESNNWALFASARDRRAGHLVVSAIEHKSVLNAALELERQGFDLTLVQPGEDGAVQLRDVEDALREETFLVSVMWANNETGVCQPVREIASLCKRRGVRFHCDAVAAMGKLPIDVGEVPCDLLSLSGHKFHAPKGVGALFVREGVELPPLLFGCGHQQGLRSGTENTVGVAAMAAAAGLAARGELGSQAELEDRRQQLWDGLRELAPDCVRNGGGDMLPGTLNVHFPGVSSAALQARLGEMGFSVAAGASASTGGASHVLLAMGLGEERASQSLRFSLGGGTRAEDVELLLEELPLALRAVRAGSGLGLSGAR